MPGVSAEGGGGEIAVNLFIPGLIAAGQFSYTPLVYDGFTTFSYFGLNSSTFDVYHRTDLGVERLEFVRGGASNLFGPGSTVGIVNYLSKQGGDTPESTVQVEFADENRFRADFATSGPIGDDGNYYAFSGYYRFDEGPVETGLDTEGYQLKGNFRHDFDDGSGSVSVFMQAIDDNVQFFLPLPLDASSQDFARGNDGKEVKTIQTGEMDNFTYPTANGLVRSPFGDGVTTSGGSLGIAFDKEYDNGWNVSLKGKYSDYSHNFVIFIPAGGDNVLTTTDFLTQQNIEYDSATFTVLSTGEELSDSDLVYRTQIWSRKRPMRDFSGEFNMSKSFDWGGNDHYVTAGLWYSRADADDFNERIFYLGDFVDQPRLLSLVLEGDNASTPGTVESGTTYYSVNGFAGSGGHVNNGGAATRMAFYLADQIESEKWSLDVGLRFESIDGDYFSEGSTSLPIDPELYGLGPDVQLESVLQNDTTGNGQFVRAEVDDTAIAFALAGVYRLNDEWNLYGNFSSGLFWPQLRNLPGQINRAAEELPLGEAVKVVEDEFGEETINRIEVGVKASTERFEGAVGLYYMEQNDNIFFQNVEQPDGTFVPTSIAQDTEATGLDLSGIFNITDMFDARFNLSFVDQEVTSGPNKGNEIQRMPDVIGTVELLYANAGWDANLGLNYRGDSFGDLGNTGELDSFEFWRAGVGYTKELDSGSSLYFSLSVFNLTDEAGLTEGNPRAGTAAVGDFGVGRPILPRTTYLRLRYDF